MEPDQGNTAAAVLQEKAYNALNEFFTSHESQVLEIEILPPAIQPMGGELMMQDGLNVGISKKVLVLAYLKARQLFFEGAKAGVISHKLLDASRIILLNDPEHITAANYRKRRILAIKAEKPNELNEVLDLELVFLNSILTSPLHRQSKSPTLWHHRAWLLDLLIPITLTDSSGKPLIVFVRAELDVVLKSGERHPKNYYAFQYGRRLFARLHKLNLDGTDHGWKMSYHEILMTSVLLVKAWCCQHPSDISGWTFLLHLLPSLEHVHQRRQIAEEVLEYAISLRAEQASLWVFLRTILADSFLEGERDVVLQSLHTFQQTRTRTGGDLSCDDRVTQAVKWINAYSKGLSEIQASQNPNAG
ncbi:protein prenylyltransferase [Pleomassaria siparia CBS 279.74]|uniref:Protein prenylyltransferase n=1 Tax=Pleomassaria siparia CBS 279.74 TaxID=1314801 RepID=A0A6G1KA13_9PLEO|nr:protein prenylyltransferase [Pleomassaria siparia CBS 279.74]